RLLGREMEVEAALGDTAGLEHVVDRGAGVAAVGEGLGGHLQDAAAGLGATVGARRGQRHGRPPQGTGSRTIKPTGRSVKTLAGPAPPRPGPSWPARAGPGP